MAKQDKSTAKDAAKAKRQASRDRRKQMFQAFKMQRREDPKLIPLMVGAFLAIAIVAFLLGLIFGVQWYVLPLGIALGVLAAVILFSRRVQNNVYSKAEGQPGAAGWALENMKGKWRLSQAVAGNAQLDAVHRVIGRPGVVLIGEGTSHRIKNMLNQEKKRIARLVGDTPIYLVNVGNGEGEVSLRRLQSHLMKLPRNISAEQVDSLESRLNALGSRTAQAQPKGPMPQGAKARSVQRSSRRR